MTNRQAWAQESAPCPATATFETEVVAGRAAGRPGGTAGGFSGCPLQSRRDRCQRRQGSGTLDWAWHGREFQDLAPTRLPVVFTGINVYRIECGQIVEGWSEPDTLGLLRLLGVVPQIAPAAATSTG